eukprot:3176574-Pyramimonas_sp.AAC.1
MGCWASSWPRTGSSAAPCLLVTAVPVPGGPSRRPTRTPPRWRARWPRGRGRNFGHSGGPRGGAPAWPPPGGGPPARSRRACRRGSIVKWIVMS